eukprot:908362-Prorocentrum_minimum.AAC.3
MPTVSNLRDLRTEKIGQLQSVTATVTRTSEVRAVAIRLWTSPKRPRGVRPELLFGCFECVECGNTIENVEQQFRFTQPTLCKNPVCGNSIFLRGYTCSISSWVSGMPTTGTNGFSTVPSAHSWTGSGSVARRARMR